MNRNICTKCILDSSVPEILFDEEGECNYCKIHAELELSHPSGAVGQEIIKKAFEKIKKRGKGKKYDCIVGLSGGTDSTYTLNLAVKSGLRPLAVHFDNGWNSDIAVQNIKNTTSKLNVDLYTHVADWEEFKDLQYSFLKASVPDAEIPTDYVIISVLLKTAAKFGVKYIIEGHSFRAEGTTPIGWSYMDGKYLKNIHRRFGKLKLKSFPILTIPSLIFYFLIRRIIFVRPLEYMNYSKAQAKKLLKDELNWIDYGGHHHESLFTKFFQSYYLPKKFRIDKRKRELSARIREGLLSRSDALTQISSTYPFEQKDVNYTQHKFGLTDKDFHDIMNEKPKSFIDYKSYFPTIQRFRLIIKIACELNILPKIFYYKYGLAHTQKIKDHWNKFESE